MRSGRNHHTVTEAIVSLVGGMTVSFLTLMISTYTNRYGEMRGQLMAGDPTVNREFPTTLNTMHAAMDGTNPILNSMTSYGWWTVVVLGGLMAAFIIFKLMRRYA